ncbi:MAG TPA: hypothetical protein VG917_00790 [Patescibacteria group bacterium]|nr:hypothetical protein [Patescibacteria group bacterium]
MLKGRITTFTIGSKTKVKTESQAATYKNDANPPLICRPEKTRETRKRDNVFTKIVLNIDLIN